MKKKFSFLINLGLSILGASSIVGATAVTLTSCADKTSAYDKSITKTLYNQYNSELASAMGNQMYYQLTKENQPKVVNLINKYLDTVNKAISATENTFNLDESIWLRSFQYELQTKKKLVESNIRYIIVNSSDQMNMTNYSKQFQRQMVSAASSWGNVNVNTKINQLNGVNTYINDVYNNLNEGLQNGTTWSAVLAKHTIGSMLQMLYSTELNSIANSSNVNDLKEGKLKGSLFTKDQGFTTWKSQTNNVSDEQKQQVEDLVNTVQQSLDKLMNFLINTYFPGIKYGNEIPSSTRTDTPKTVQLDFAVSQSNPNEEDNGFMSSGTGSSSKKYIKGLGLSADDLTVKDIGIGFSGATGQAIYKALLQKHSNVIDADPAKQYEFGDQQTGDILDAMIEVAHQIGDLKTGTTKKEWKETYMYDKDSSGNTYGSEEKKDVTIRESDGSIDMGVFFEWLNSDQFFNGRDMTKDQFPTIDGTNKLDNGPQDNKNSTRNKPYKYKGYFTNTDLVANIIGYKDDTDANKTITWGDAGNLYVKYIKQGLSPATVQFSNTIKNDVMAMSISPAAAYVGASRAVYQYLTYKASVNSHIAAPFKYTPHDWTLRTGTGGAAYASSGEGASDWVNEGWGGFYLDVNPYFGLQKWSMSTLANHEAVSGHVFQFAYAEAHPSDSDAVSFRSTAYAEGWGLFSEWFATQLGIYGEPTLATGQYKAGTDGSITFEQKDVLTLPKFGSKSKTTDITKLDADYANGAYAITAVQNSATSPRNTQAATTTYVNNQSYYDALQYFGFLNERQLRAMRIAVDVGIHAGEGGTFAAGTGMSLSDARKYLSSNSGLGIDDINRETKRYLEYTGQATSYYNGLVDMQSYFLKAKTLFEQKNPGQTFLNWEDPAKTRKNTQDLFDLILRNGSVPMPVLSWAVDKYLTSKYGEPSVSAVNEIIEQQLYNVEATPLNI